MVHPVAINFAKSCCHLFAGRRNLQLIGAVSARGLSIIIKLTVLNDIFCHHDAVYPGFKKGSSRYIPDSNGASPALSKARLEC